MEYHEFVGQVQHRARLPSFEDAITATRVTLETLAERLAGGAPANLAAQLPREIGIFLRGEAAGAGRRLSLPEFHDLVASRMGVDAATARVRARAVLSVLDDAVSSGELAKIRHQLPAEFAGLFEGDEFRGMTP